MSAKLSLSLLGQRYLDFARFRDVEWAAVTKEVAKVSPEVKVRTAGNGEDPIQGVKSALVDLTNAHKLLGFERFIPWESMVVDAASSLIENERRIQA
ncbi:hypothetical protein M422DRAFT_263075 [Sphaerobolus stellatus SS14]|uniref:Uncharacterized protein n=1 Tax=Sphaerobolus stellatus (strain SS14) TaxID=990650 RepID=A0A0C9UZI7_SPHS4|nr:hypothetical protein M422DRAFT_263075 [Sphaerobolus stellatus SS14]